MVMDLFSVAGIVVLIFLTIFFGRILTIALRVLFYVLITALVLVFFFGVSLDTLLNFLSKVLLLAF